MKSNILLTTKELVERWKNKVSEGTIENWRNNGKGPKFIRLNSGKRSPIIYRLSDIEEYERKQTVKNK